MGRAVAAAATQVGARLPELTARLALEEAVVLTLAYQPEVRRRSCALLTREFGLAASS